jgi:hypothetical protein
MIETKQENPIMTPKTIIVAVALFLSATSATLAAGTAMEGPTHGAGVASQR